MENQVYKQSVIAAQKEAAEYLEHSPLKHLKEVLTAATWDDFYRNSLNQPALHAFHDVQQALAAELCLPIVNLLKTNGYQKVDYYAAVDDATNKFHYRFLEFLGKKPEEINRSWTSKYLSRSSITNAVFGRIDKQTYEKLEGSLYLRDQESHLAYRITDFPIGERPYEFAPEYFKRKGVKLQDIYTDFAENGKPEELLSVLLSHAMRADGLRDHYPHDQIFNHVVSKAAEFLYNDPNIGRGDIALLRSAGEVSPKRLWDTQFFHERHAPVIDDKYLKSMASHFHRRHQDSLLFSLKDNLSHREIFTHILSSGQRSEIETWKYAMAGFEALTGERITFKQAQDMHLPSFNIHATQVYSDYVDANINPNDYRAIKTTISRCEDEDYKYDDGDKAFMVFIECKSLNIECISDALDRTLLGNTNLKQWGGTQDGMHFELTTDKENWESVGKAFATKLVKDLKKINAEAILPGDRIVVDTDQWEDWELEPGHKAVVADVYFNGDVKLEGQWMYYPGELFKVDTKYNPHRAPSSSLTP